VSTDFWTPDGCVWSAGYSAINGTLATVNRDLGIVTTITAAAVHGLNASTAINLSQAVGTVQDPLANVASMRLDSLDGTDRPG
jgi:hypothetical protein